MQLLSEIKNKFKRLLPMSKGKFQEINIQNDNLKRQIDAYKKTSRQTDLAHMLFIVLF